MIHTMTRARPKRFNAALLLDWLAALGLLLLALPIVLYRLDAQSLWLDEGTTHATVTGSRLGGLLLDLFNPTSAYPLYHLVVKVATRVLGDGEWALRLPSALAGALAVSALYALGTELRGRITGLSAALLLLVAPWGLRLAQDAKAYSLALLAVIVLALLFARALRLRTRRAWLWFSVAAVAAPFVHRLLLLSLVGCGVCWAALDARGRRWPALIALAVVAVALVGAIAGGLRYQGAGGQFAGVGPVAAVPLTLSQFAVGLYPGDVPRLWFVPFALLALLGLAQAINDLRSAPGQSADTQAAARHRARAAAVLLFVGGVPLLLFLLLLALQPLYEPRYLVGVYPFWLLLLAWGVPLNPRFARASSGRLAQLMTGALVGALLAGALVVQRNALFQPDKGIFSGAPIKEQYREAVAYLAQHVHPDDLVIVHPDTARPLYTYYARRVADFPLPESTTYSALGRAENFEARELDMAIRSDLGKRKRAWLLIAPDHAAVVDPPAAGDELGLVGLAFQYGDQNRRIQCGPPPFVGFNGVRVYCNNIPEIDGRIPEPAIRVEATFGGQLRLRGYSVTPFAGGPVPGGTLPVSLFWEPLTDLAATDYLVFLHLTLPDDPRPLAQSDGRPMEEGQPTSRWTKPHALLHDDRTIRLPDTLPPGRYVLRMGVYQASDAARLDVRSAAPVQDNAVVLGEVHITAP